jgi:DNA-directed RNA polymerase I subunit RPA1
MKIAQKAAKEVYIEGFGKISECRMVEYDPTEKTVRWDQKKAKEHSDMKTQPADNREHLRYWALKAAGVDFGAFWEIGDDLDVTRIYSNNIHAMLKTYGVEAARRTIITEVTNVFEAYGVKVDYRHLSLIADYMTHTGGYRPMSRHGSIAESLSPLAKMSFETASKFIVEAASHGMTDDLETPSSRISLGLPVKMGTGSFDIMQNLEF